MVGVVVFSMKKIGLGLGCQIVKKNGLVLWLRGCGQLKLGLGVAVHGLIGLGVPKPHFAHP